MVSVNGLFLCLGICLGTVASLVVNLDHVTEGTELVFAFMVHRHGDRTPVIDTISAIGDSVNWTEADRLISQYDYGQLTDAGKRSGFKCGEFIRRRYDGILSSKYNKSEIYIRTTDSTRVKMTSLTAMSAVFPAGEDNWSDRINWTPVPYTTIPAKYDFNLGFINCPKYVKHFHEMYSSDHERMKPHAEVIAKISSVADNNITRTPLVVFDIYDAFVSLKSLGYNFSEEILEIMDDLSKANNEVWDIADGDESYIHLQAGPLLNEFFKYANLTISGANTQKVRIYAAHDFNVYSLKAVTRVGKQGAPKYASLYSLELRRFPATGQYVVLPVFLDDPSRGVEEYLQVEGCSGEYLCDYYEFLNLTSKYVRDEDTWRIECDFDFNMVIDTTNID